MSNLYPDARLPAFGTFVAAHVDALRRAGAEIDLLAITGIPAHAAVVRKYAFLAARALAVAFRGRLAGRRPEVVEAHVAYPTAVPAWIASRILGARLVVYSHGTDVTSAGGGFHRRLARKVFRAADLHVATSAFVAGELMRRFGVDAGKVVVLSPGIDVKRFVERDPAAPREGILFVGRLARGKGVHELIQAVARLDGEPPLRFVGDGPERNALEHEATSRGINATFDGALPPNEVARAMQRAAIVTIPSTYPEGLGLVALEGMAAGAMVVGSRIGGIPESIIDGETGWLVPPGDVEALAAALSDALQVAGEDSPRRAALLERARNAAGSHDADEMAKRTLSAYASLIAS